MEEPDSRTETFTGDLKQAMLDAVAFITGHEGAIDRVKVTASKPDDVWIIFVTYVIIDLDLYSHIPF